MKKQIVFIALVSCFLSVGFAQQIGYSYQSLVTRNSPGLGVDVQEELKNHPVNVRFTLRSGSEDGEVFYQEEHNTKTNAFGILNAIVGNGFKQVGDQLQSLDWVNVTWYLQVDLDINDGKGYVLMSSEPILVPPHVKPKDQELILDGSILSISGDPGSSVDLEPVIGQEGVNGDELQTLEAGAGPGELSISKRNSVVINVEDQDADPTNENQTISAGSAIMVMQTGHDFEVSNTAPDQIMTLMDGGAGNVTIGGVYPDFTIDVPMAEDNDADPINEIQDLQLTGNTLSITNNTNATDIDLTPYQNSPFNLNNEVISNNGPASEDFVFGSTQLDDIEDTYEDNRKLFFDKSKGAFRAGYVIGDRWNDDLVGDNSIGLGRNVLASGIGSFATGRDARASGPSSVAIGPNTNATGHNAVAIGSVSRATGTASLALASSFAAGDGALAFGEQSESHGSHSVAIGFYAVSTGDFSHSFGNYLYARSPSETAIGRFNTDYSPEINDTDRLFVVGNGTHFNNRSNALVMLKNGNTTLNGSLTIDEDNVGGEDGYTLPAQDGVTNQILTTAGDGTTSWQDPTGDSPFNLNAGIVSNKNPGAEDFVFGSSSLNDLTGTDDDARVFFDKSKGAFRAGAASGDRWDDGNVGNFSVGLGQSAQASGNHAIAIGQTAYAEGASSTALGAGSHAGDDAVAIGLSSANFGSVAIGNSNQATGIWSTAIGYSNFAVGDFSYSGGFISEAYGVGSVSLGSSLITRSAFEVALGSMNTDYNPDNATDFDPDDRIFTVGNGDLSLGALGRSDALVMLKNGNTTLNGQLTIDGDNVGGLDEYTLPAQDGTDGQVMMTNGNGAVSWQNGGGGSFNLNNGVIANYNADTDDFVIGSPQLADDGDSGHDRRMFFDKSRGAFRAGRATENQWDDITGSYNIGNYSTALGYNTIASGTYSFAVGNGSVASATNSIALGNGADALASSTVAIGSSSMASQSNAVALGVFSEALANGAQAFGYSAMASAQFATAAGTNSEAIGNYSSAFGYSVDAVGENSSAYGFASRAQANRSLAIGYEVTATSYAESALGIYNVVYTPQSATSFDTDDRLLVIGNGTGINDRSNAFELFKSGDATLYGQLTIDDDNVGGTSGYTLPGQDGLSDQVLRTDGNGLVSWVNRQEVILSVDDLGLNYSLPEADGTTGQVIQTNGSGTTDWTDLPEQSPFSLDGGTDIISNSNVDNDDIFIFGSPSLSASENNSYRSRMYFDKNRRAFRAGYTSSSTVWADNDWVGDYSIGLGRDAAAIGDYSLAIGDSPSAYGENSIALGDNAIARGENGVSIGRSLDSYAYGSITLGTFATIDIGANAFGFDYDDRLFTIGNGFSSLNRSNALVMLKNGNTTLNGELTIDADNIGDSGGYTLPGQDASFSGYVLQTDGSGIVSWIDPSLLSSDRRLKENILPLSSSLEKIRRLEGVNFNWNGIKKRDTLSIQTGLIAQEVEKVFPELVSKRSDGYLQVSYTELIPHLIEAIKELKAENDELKKKIYRTKAGIVNLSGDAEKRMVELYKRLTAIEQALLTSSSHKKEVDEPKDK